MLTELKPLFCVHIPEEIESGVLYISEEYTVSIHLCACGCGNKTVLPFRKDKIGDTANWNYTNNNGLVSFKPSILNSGLPCKAHYYITDNKIVW